MEFQTRTRLISGPDSIARLPEIARELGFKHTLLVADAGIRAAGHVATVTRLMAAAGARVESFEAFTANPDSDAVERGRAFAAPLEIDSIIGLGGGSSMDCAKAINFLLTNGGRMEDYQGFGKASRPMLPSIGIPTTSGTGSEAQCYALISNAGTHVKMACGDPKAAFRVAILDPVLTISQPRAVKAAAGYDAISHAVESFVTTRRNPISEMFAREAFRLLRRSYAAALEEKADIESLGGMQLGAHLAGIAIEHSMLGATHACANPLTAHYGAGHGNAIATLLPHVVRWNQPVAGARYSEFHPNLPSLLEDLAEAGGLAVSLAEHGVPKADLPWLARDAAQEWTGKFNPRPFDSAGALEIYRCAY
jgi:alcohol dehydrogenase class IV